MTEYDVFVSYSKQDADFVRSLVAALEARGVRAWYDGGEIRVGESFMRKIEDALEQSRYFLLVISPDYLSGQWTPFELGVALSAAATRGARVLSVVRDADFATLPAPLKRHQWIRYTVYMWAEQLVAEIVKIVEQQTQGRFAQAQDSPDTVKVSLDSKL